MSETPLLRTIRSVCVRRPCTINEILLIFMSICHKCTFREISSQFCVSNDFCFFIFFEVSVSRTLFFSLIHGISLPVTLSLSITLSLTHKHSLYLSHSFSIFHSRPLSLSHSLTQHANLRRSPLRRASSSSLPLTSSSPTNSLLMPTTKYVLVLTSNAMFSMSLLGYERMQSNYTCCLHIHPQFIFCVFMIINSP